MVKAWGRRRGCLLWYESLRDDPHRHSVRLFTDDHRQVVSEEVLIFTRD